MDVREFHQSLLAEVGLRADAEGDYMQSAFTRTVGERLAEAGEFESLEVLDFEGTGKRRRTLRVNGYDLDNQDASVALVVSLFNGGGYVESVGVPEIKAQLKSLQSYLEDAVDGSFLEGREHSDPAYQLASDLRDRGSVVSRYRLFFITDGRASDRLKELPSVSVGGVPVDFHIWDIERLLQLSLSSSDHEPLDIDITEWADKGIPALAVRHGASEDFSVYLACMPGSLVAGLYGRYGSRLLESNVRSYLSNRGKVNRGIKDTIIAKPSRFLAYNNGITATAASVETTPDGSIARIRDLQIVNGGQTTASLFFVGRDSRDANLDAAFVQMKLVVLDTTTDPELVPKISQYANSQNAVSASDFFSNHEFHQRIESLSRRVLVPAALGSTLNTKWYYERTKGQYENEKSLRAGSASARFEKEYPKRQRIDKPSLAKYTMAWEQQPHVVSLGAQKNFAAFANHVEKTWEKDPDSFNEAYFKEAIAKGILFEDIRSAVGKAEWYEKGYLANIVAYTVAKIANVVAQSARGRVLDFERIWREQKVQPSLLAFALDIAQEVQAVLTSDTRAVQNVTEWAKKPECWNRVRALRVEIPVTAAAGLADPVAVATAKRQAKDNQKIDNGIDKVVKVMDVPAAHWAELRDFGLANRLVAEKDLSILKLVTNGMGIPSDRQAARLCAIVEAANSRGFETFQL
ncbi:AIPR family protein [Sinomonas halotolerans]|uniref:AIPR family protein n=1 Tax=Sinomonas halotolerans TaxID=1644133 RepID=A0ABU9X1U7_9MICC